MNFYCLLLKKNFIILRNMTIETSLINKNYVRSETVRVIGIILFIFRISKLSRTVLYYVLVGSNIVILHKFIYIFLKLKLCCSQ